MDTIYGATTLRPTRIGFLVRPTQRNISQVREVFRLCSCLWGGMYNPIIPVCGASLPSPWRERRFREITSKGLAEAYVQFFEPDVFVEAEKGLAHEIGIVETPRFHYSRITSLKNFIQTDRKHGDFAFGLSAFDAYRELYQKDFKFVHRKRQKAVVFEGDDAYCEAVFGSFPHLARLNYFKNGYKDIWEPEFLSPTAENCLKVLKGQYISPFGLGHYKLDVNFDGRDDPIIFVFDPTKTIDLIDLWNLRQFKADVLPINVHWFDTFKALIRKGIAKNYRPLPGNKHGVMINTTVEFARSIPQAIKDEITNVHLTGLPAGSLSRKDWYDPIWRTDWRGGGVQPRRAKLSGEQIDFEETVNQDDPYLRLRALAPQFARKYAFVNNHARWMNVVNLSDFISYRSRFALTFPPNIKGGDFPRIDAIGSGHVTREGIVSFRQYKTDRLLLKLLSPQDAVIGWLKSKGVEAKISSAGRNAEQVLRSVEEKSSTSLFADEGTVKLLDKMAKTIHREPDGTTFQYPDRTASIAEWKEVLGRRSRAVFSTAKLSDFTKNNVMRIGISVSCPHCAQDNWYSLSDLDYQITCERCLKPYPFPQSGLKFNEGDWRYRVLGPFSVPNYADGAYATVLSLRLFTQTLNANRTPSNFSTGLDITLREKNRRSTFLVGIQRAVNSGSIRALLLSLARPKALGLKYSKIATYIV